MKRYSIGPYLSVSVLVLRILLLVILLVPFEAFGQQPATPPSPQEQLDRVRLELAYADREHQMCRVSLADLWARGNSLEIQVKQLQEEKQKLTDDLKALKEPANAPATK